MKSVLSALALTLGSCSWAIALRADEIQLGVSVGTSKNLRDGSRGAIVTLTPLGPDGRRIVAGRVTVSQALEGTGQPLTQSGTGNFYSIGVGRVDDSRDLTSNEPITFSLWSLSKDAKALKSVDGKLELVIPDLDPHSAVAVDGIASRYGTALDSPDLAAERVHLVVYGRETAERMARDKAPDGPQSYDGGPMFGPPRLPMAVIVAAGIHPSAMEDGDIAVGISDPDSRLLSVEFQTAQAQPISYNHGGRYHSSQAGVHPELRFDVYHLPAGLPADARMVCRLLTSKSVVATPFHLENVALPQGTERQHDSGVIICVLGESMENAKANVEYERTAAEAKKVPAPQGIQEKVDALWSANPVYTALLKSDAHFDSFPKLVSSVPPRFPDVPPLYPAHEIVVTVSFLVGTDGAVEAAKVAESNDARFDQAAVDAVLKWHFVPAMMAGTPAKMFVIVPFHFNFPTLGAAGSKAATGP